MPYKNERVALEMQIMKYRQMLARITDVEFLEKAKEKIAELGRSFARSTNRSRPD